MKRFHALEWEDLEWFPKSWRDHGTDYLMFFATRFDIYKPVVPIIQKGIDASSKQEWIDCASGGGGSLIRLAEHLKSDYPELKITLTDYFPNEEAFERTINHNPKVFSYEKGSVDAMNLPDEMKGKFRTLFAAFHHFRPKDASKILQNAIDTRSPIAVFEPVGRNFPSFFSMLFVILNVLLITPFIRPVRWQVFPFVYLIPIIPIYILWDGIASIFRTYSKKELKEMVANLKDHDSFDWEIGLIKQGPAPVYYLLGIPKTESPQNTP